MKGVKIAIIAVIAYVGIVVAFESLIGFFQPTADSTLVLTTFDEGGEGHDRVVSKLESEGQLYVAANHWPRAWYSRTLDNPQVQVTMDGETADYQAARVDDAEYARVNEEHGLPFVFRILTGFPPREILRLDPR